jgi:hypothetical protein
MHNTHIYGTVQQVWTVYINLVSKSSKKYAFIHMFSQISLYLISKDLTFSG